jgi:hypothetical protein
MAGYEKEDSVSYNSDPRLSCKYGQKCYQKNAVHHQKYKHPTKRRVEVSYTSCKSSDASVFLLFGIKKTELQIECLYYFRICCVIKYRVIY